MNSFFSLYISTIIETLLVTLFIRKTINSNTKIISLKVFYLLFGSILIIICKKYITINLILLITSSALLLISACFYLSESIKTILPAHIMASVYILFFVELPTIPLAKILSQEGNLIVVHCALIFVWGLILIKLIPLNRFYSYIKSQSPLLYTLAINISLLAISVMWYSQINRTFFFENIMLILFIAIVIIFINIEVIASTIKSHEKEKRLELLEQYLPVLDEMIQTIRKRQHNYNSQITALRALPYTHKTYEELANALIDNYIPTNNPMPSYLLNMNLTIVAGYLYKKKMDVHTLENKMITISIDSYDLPTVHPQYEIIELLDILINNSLEAIPKHTSMYLRIGKTSANKLILETKNQGPAAGTELNKKIFKYGYSSKSSSDKYGRGLGLPYLKEYVDNNDGTIAVTNETIDGVRMLVFTVEI